MSTCGVAERSGSEDTCLAATARRISVRVYVVMLVAACVVAALFRMPYGDPIAAIFMFGAFPLYVVFDSVVSKRFGWSSWRAAFLPTAFGLLVYAVHGTDNPAIIGLIESYLAILFCIGVFVTRRIVWASSPHLVSSAVSQVERPGRGYGAMLAWAVLLGMFFGTLENFNFRLLPFYHRLDDLPLSPVDEGAVLLLTALIIFPVYVLVDAVRNRDFVNCAARAIGLPLASFSGYVVVELLSRSYIGFATAPLPLFFYELWHTVTDLDFVALLAISVVYPLVSLLVVGGARVLRSSGTTAK